MTRRWLGKIANLKTEVTRTQSTLNFPKHKHILPPDTHACVWINDFAYHYCPDLNALISFVCVNIDDQEVLKTYLPYSFYSSFVSSTI